MTPDESLRANIDKVAYNNVYDTEKIVKIDSGSFLYGTDTITRSYTFAGSPYNVEAFRYEHGFTRPVFVEMVWSLDGINYFPGGGTYGFNFDYAIGYSDDTYVYIMVIPDVAGITTGDQIFYEVVCSWIDDYDDTNPDVPAFIRPAGADTVFISTATTPPIVDSGILTASTANTTNTIVTKTADHTNDYSPAMRVFVESFDGEVWPQNYGGNSNPYNVDDDQVECLAFTTSTQVILSFITNSANGERRAWYSLYGKNIVDGTDTYTETDNAL